MIQFKDFRPEPTQEGWFNVFWPTLDVLVATMNQWAADAAVEIVNVETVIVPTLASGTASTHLAAESWDLGAYQTMPAFQFIRVWYREAA